MKIRTVGLKVRKSCGGIKGVKISMLGFEV